MTPTSLDHLPKTWRRPPDLPHLGRRWTDGSSLTGPVHLVQAAQALYHRKVTLFKTASWRRTLTSGTSKSTSRRRLDRPVTLPPVAAREKKTWCRIPLDGKRARFASWTLKRVTIFGSCPARESIASIRHASIRGCWSFPARARSAAKVRRCHVFPKCDSLLTWLSQIFLLWKTSYLEVQRTLISTERPTITCTTGSRGILNLRGGTIKGRTRRTRI
jgi:hypothetical protein